MNLVISKSFANFCASFFHHFAGKDLGFDLFSFSVSNSEADGWIFMLIAYNNAPFVLVW